MQTVTWSRQCPEQKVEKVHARAQSGLRGESWWWAIVQDYRSEGMQA
jgi:hypothetical protein